MMKKILFTAVFLTSVISFSQQTIIENVKFDDNTILVGMASDYNTDKTYDQLNFILDEPHELKDVQLNLEHGYELNTKLTDENHFMIYAIKDRKIVNQWLVNPKLYNVFYNGVAYSFDADKLKEIAEKYPLKVLINRQSFKNEKEYKKIKKELDKDQSILLVYEPSFMYEGSYELSLKKDDKITNVEQAEAYVKDLVAPLTKKEVLVSYILNEKNLMDRSQITLSVAGPKIVYDKLKTDLGEKGEWIPEVYEAIIVKQN